jgi:hypothetical protein
VASRLHYSELHLRILPLNCNYLSIRTKIHKSCYDIEALSRFSLSLVFSCFRDPFWFWLVLNSWHESQSLNKLDPFDPGRLIITYGITTGYRYLLNFVIHITDINILLKINSTIVNNYLFSVWDYERICGAHIPPCPLPSGYTLIFILIWWPFSVAPSLFMFYFSRCGRL